MINKIVQLFQVVKLIIFFNVVNSYDMQNYSILPV